MPNDSVILGIESSCDDTAAAVIANGKALSSETASQQIHARFGGVVPELASRAHQRRIVPVVRAALWKANVAPSDLSAVAVTRGPGLAGSLLVGLGFARAYAFGLGIPVIGINHLEGHVFSACIGQELPKSPWLCLIVSGGHTQLALVEDRLTLRPLGTTRDDAAGEAFDKVARLLDLGYPGGPAIDRLAAQGDPNFHAFPRARLAGYDFSFSGLKTSVLYYLNGLGDEKRAALMQRRLPDLCAAFQEAVVDMLIDPLRQAIAETGVREVHIVGGVSANARLRQQAKTLGETCGVRIRMPQPAYCMDNAAMIAFAAHVRLAAGQTNAPDHPVMEPNLALGTFA